MSNRDRVAVAALGLLLGILVGGWILEGLGIGIWEVFK